MEKRTKTKNKISCIAIGSLLIAGASLICIPSGMRFSGYLCLGLALVWAAGWALERASARGRVWRALRRLYLAALCLGLAVFLAIEGVVIFHGEAGDTGRAADAVIVLGAGVNGETPSAALWSRIEAAREYLADRPDIPVVLSGGQGAGESISEAEAMRRALCTGDPAWDSRFLLEERSTDTAENFRFSKELLEANGVDTETAVVAVVTNDFHCFRAAMIARHMGLQTIDVPAELPWWWLSVNYYLRESVGVVKTALLDLR